MPGIGRGSSRGGGADDLEDGVASARWTTVVTHPDDLGWLREALRLRTENATEAEDDDGHEDT